MTYFTQIAELFICIQTNMNPAIIANAALIMFRSPAPRASLAKIKQHYANKAI